MMNIQVRRFIDVTVLTISLFLAVGSVLAQESGIQFSALPAEEYKVSRFIWGEGIGGRKGEPQTAYMLMSQGGFLAPKSSNFKVLVKAWLAKHPNADVVVVYTLEGDTKSSKKIKWAWVIDGDENLNVHLVRMGGCSADTMFLNKGDKAHVAKEKYESFTNKVLEAESLARKERRGIWSEKN
jgi:hypothetical protein